jgi:hypothetical protein
VFDTTAEADLYYEVINPPAHQEQEGVITKGEHKSEEARGSRRDKGNQSGEPEEPKGPNTRREPAGTNARRPRVGGTVRQAKTSRCFV